MRRKVVKIPIQVLESYDFMTLQHQFDPNPTMNLNLVESMLSPDPNHRILYNFAKSRSYLWTLPILMISWVLLLTVVGYYINLPNHFHLSRNPLFNKFVLWLWRYARFSLIYVLYLYTKLIKIHILIIWVIGIYLWYNICQIIKI
jgi:hypothetical protein